jgi:hypothetical protein
MKVNWKDHAHLVAEWDEKLRKSTRWRAFVAWLDVSESYQEFMPDLLEALRKACDTFDPAKGTLEWWAYWKFRDVRKRFLTKRKKWKKETGGSPLSLDTPVREGPGLERGLSARSVSEADRAIGRKARQALQDRRAGESFDGVVDPPSDPGWLESQRSPLTYRMGWRQAVRSRTKTGTKRRKLLASLPAISDSSDAALARRTGWRLLAR